jgi:hypothetical protein
VDGQRGPGQEAEEDEEDEDGQTRAEADDEEEDDKDAATNQEEDILIYSGIEGTSSPFDATAHQIAQGGPRGAGMIEQDGGTDQRNAKQLAVTLWTISVALVVLAVTGIIGVL